MDALTHAVEAYANLYSEEKSNQQVMQAVKMILKNLHPAYEDRKNIEIRNKMLKAIKDLNASMQISDKIIKIKQQDIPALATRTVKEANPMYPVPEIWDVSKMIEVINKLCI